MKEKLYTTATIDYDWGWTTEIITNVAITKQGKPVRLVEIEDAYHARMQAGRYYSGLHGVWTQDQYDKEIVSGWITPTPDKAIYHFQFDFDMEAAITDKSKRKAMMKMMASSKPDYYFKNIKGMHYRLIVSGLKEEAERKFAELSGRIEMILS